MTRSMEKKLMEIPKNWSMIRRRKPRGIRKRSWRNSRHQRSNLKSNRLTQSPITSMTSTKKCSTSGSLSLLLVSNLFNTMNLDSPIMLKAMSLGNGSQQTMLQAISSLKRLLISLREQCAPLVNAMT